MRIYPQGAIAADSFAQKDANFVQVVDVYTPEGIFVVTDRGIFRQDVVDGPCRAINVNGGKMLVDESQYSLVRVHQLPLSSQIEGQSSRIVGRRQLTTVSSRIQGRLKVICKSVEGRVVDYWFETDETDVDMVLQDLSA